LAGGHAIGSAASVTELVRVGSVGLSDAFLVYLYG